MNKVKPLLRGHFHQEMFFVSLGASILLLAKAAPQGKLLAILIYVVGVLFLFGISALYHRVTWDLKSRAFMRKLDHTAIYLMIAATSTPVGLFALPTLSQEKFLLSIWLVALFGFVQSLFFVNIPKFISAILYVAAGYMVAPYFQELSPVIGSTNVYLLIWGGISYTVGAICYALKRPKLKASVFGYHEVFHLLVAVGAILHFIMIYSLI